MRFSSITSMPSRSQASSSSGVGGLCECDRRCSQILAARCGNPAAVGHGGADAGVVLMVAGALELQYLPLRKKPSRHRSGWCECRTACRALNDAAACASSLTSLCRCRGFDGPQGRCAQLRSCRVNCAVSPAFSRCTADAANGDLQRHDGSSMQARYDPALRVACSGVADLRAQRPARHPRPEGRCAQRCRLRPDGRARSLSARHGDRCPRPHRTSLRPNWRRRGP